MRVLIDVDDTLADFAPSFLDLAYKVTGKRYHITDFDTWLFDNLTHFTAEEAKALWLAVDNTPGFIRNLPPVEGAVSALTELRLLGDVFAVTSPHLGPLWFYERAMWLKQHGFGRSTMAFITTKQYVTGDVFIDDNPDHINNWKAHHPKGLALLWHRYNTRNYSTIGIRVFSWEEVIERILQYQADTGIK